MGDVSRLSGGSYWADRKMKIHQEGEWDDNGARRDQLKDTEESFILMNWTVGHAQAHKNTCVGERRDGEKSSGLGPHFPQLLGGNFVFHFGIIFFMSSFISSGFCFWVLTAFYQ